MADLVTIRTYESYLVVDTGGEMKLAKRRPELSAREVCYTIHVEVPITRIPIPAGQINLRLPELSGTGISVEIENQPVMTGAVQRHLFRPADLVPSQCSRCGLNAQNFAHSCVRPDCKAQAVHEHSEIPYCAEHDPRRIDKKAAS